MRYLMFYWMIHVLSVMAQVQALPTVHIFGDSHSYFSFSDNSIFNSVYFYQGATVPLSVHYLGPRTMYHIGAHGLNGLNIKNYGVTDGQIAVFTFGEIDARCHIGRQCDMQKRTLEGVVQELVHNYLQTICQNRALYNNLQCIVMEIMPPTDACFNREVPFYGTLAQRILITRTLNEILLRECRALNVLFLPIHDIVANAEGSLNTAVSDNCVHINMQYNHLIKNRLIEVLLPDL